MSVSNSPYATEKRSELRPVPHGEWAGWLVRKPDPYGDRAGPFYQRVDQSGNMVTAFRAGSEHMNGGGWMAGGCFVSLADAALMGIALKELQGAVGVTLNLSADFLDAAMPGELVEASGEIVRATRSLIFIWGIVTAGGRPALSFSGIVKRISPR